MPNVLEITIEVRSPKGDKTTVGEMRNAGGILDWVPKELKLVDTIERGAAPDETIKSYRFTK